MIYIPKWISCHSAFKDIPSFHRSFVPLFYQSFTWLLKQVTMRNSRLSVIFTSQTLQTKPMLFKDWEFYNITKTNMRSFFPLTNQWAEKQRDRYLYLFIWLTNGVRSRASHNFEIWCGFQCDSILAAKVDEFNTLRIAEWLCLRKVPWKSAVVQLNFCKLLTRLCTPVESIVCQRHL